jgi:hypothetical protein
VPRAAAELSVGRGAETGVALERDDVADRRVLGGAKPRGVERTGRVARSGREELRRSQQAADVIGAVRRLGTLHHFLFLVPDAMQREAVHR